MPHGGKMTIEISTASHIGKYRKEQEDAFLVESCPEKNAQLLVVCDGMGGHEHGRWAADTCVEVFKDKWEESLENLCKEADGKVSIGPPGFVRRFSTRTPGTTVVAGRLTGDKLQLVSVGDSYIYKITDKVETLNTIHEGMEGGLTAFVGGGSTGYFQIWSGEVILDEDATYLLVTDGVDYMKKEDLLYCKHAQDVVDKVLEGNAYDNITCIMIDVKDCAKKLV